MAGAQTYRKRNVFECFGGEGVVKAVKAGGRYIVLKDVMY